MNFISVVSLFTGISIFTLGMLMIKHSLQENLGEKLKFVLCKTTGNRFMGVFTGIWATVAMQSSSASSVITATLVDREILSLYDAFWIIVGANVGTTFTGLLTAASFSEIAPLSCIVGIILLSLSGKKKLYFSGLLLTGFGLIFVGMNIMGDAADVIRCDERVVKLLMNCDTPLNGVTVGCLFTAVIQSSSAVTALLQTLATDGGIGIKQCFYILLGANIGTCATCLIASFGLKGGAGRVAVMHILYNLSGSLLFVAAEQFFSVSDFVSITGYDIRTQIALLNIIFNVVTALIALLLPIRRHESLHLPHIRKRTPA